MARKRRADAAVATPQTETKETPRYVDPFQSTVGRSIESAGRRLEGNGRRILYIVGAALAVLIIIWLITATRARQTAAAQAALGRAIETAAAPVTSSAPQPGGPSKTFKTERERALAAVSAFEAVAQKYSGDVAQKAKYFAAVNKLSIDRAAALADLENLSNSGDAVGKLSKFALANAKADDGKTDDAIALLQELSTASDPVLAKETVDFRLASLYEKQGKKQEAADVLFNLVKAALDARDVEGKPVTLSATAQSAKDKLESLDPERAKQLPQPEPAASGDAESGN